MRVSELERLCGATCLTGEYEDREIACATPDPLSHVMGRGQADMAWITVQTHMNDRQGADGFCLRRISGRPARRGGDCGQGAAGGRDPVSSGRRFELAALLAANGVPPARKE
ncbi:MAG: hypothetical protein ACLUI3_00775 [Christensenellales bacterium]